MSGYYWCDQCEGNAGGTHCAACGHVATWHDAAPRPAAPVRRKHRVALPPPNPENARQLFERMRQICAQTAEPEKVRQPNDYPASQRIYFPEP